VSIKTYFGIVERTKRWDQATPAHEQAGFADHAAFMHGLEAEGFIALAGLLQVTYEVVFLFHAQDEQQVRHRLGQDPWQKDGRVALIRLEEIQIRVGAPPHKAA